LSQRAKIVKMDINLEDQDPGNGQLSGNLDSLVEHEKYGEQLRCVTEIFMPLALQLPKLRDDPTMMAEIIKATASSGITDVATHADVHVQEQIKQQVLANHPDWQFWGEEGDDRVTDYDETKGFLFITDPIEGTNNFKAHKDEDWGSVAALVDIATKEPVVGVVADPVNRRAYVGVKGGGAYIVHYAEDGSAASYSQMSAEPEAAEFTYNNSPHFEDDLTGQVDRFFALGTVQPDNLGVDDLEKSRKTLTVKTRDNEVRFVDLESGALEAVRNRGTIYFKTSNEMAAVFVILGELGGKVTDANGSAWTLGINTLIAARDALDYGFLKVMYDKTITVSTGL
jgi:fructose-1,6-bisphosphatase/inositol monophosphatase family enzyme